MKRKKKKVRKKERKKEKKKERKKEKQLHMYINKVWCLLNFAWKQPCITCDPPLLIQLYLLTSFRKVRYLSFFESLRFIFARVSFDGISERNGISAAIDGTSWGTGTEQWSEDWAMNIEVMTSQKCFFCNYGFYIFICLDESIPRQFICQKNGSLLHWTAEMGFWSSISWFMIKSVV